MKRVDGACGGFCIMADSLRDVVGRLTWSRVFEGEGGRRAARLQALAGRDPPDEWLLGDRRGRKSADADVTPHQRPTATNRPASSPRRQWVLAAPPACTTTTATSLPSTPPSLPLPTAARELALRRQPRGPLHDTTTSLPPTDRPRPRIARKGQTNIQDGQSHLPDQTHRPPSCR